MFIGRGQYGEVFLAKAPGLIAGIDEPLVCVKPLHSREEAIKLEFRQEVEMYHKLSHDRICRLLALCREREPIYMILEYCEWVRIDSVLFFEMCAARICIALYICPQL